MHEWRKPFKSERVYRRVTRPTTRPSPLPAHRLTDSPRMAICQTRWRPDGCLRHARIALDGWRSDDQFGFRVVGEVRRAGDDDRGAGPRLFPVQERDLLVEPVRHVPSLLDRIAVAGHQQALLG